MASNLLVPPGYKEAVPAGYFPIQFETVNGYALLRAIAASASQEDQVKAIDLVKQIRLYTLAQASNPPEQTYMDMSGKLLDGVVAFDDSFYQRLARMVNEEPVMTHRNTDGSVDIYFGPKAPAGHEENWVPTKASATWFTMFRFYGPDKAVFDKSWKLADIESVK